MNWKISQLIWEDSGSLKRVIKTVVSKFSNTISGSSASVLHLTNVSSSNADDFITWDNLVENNVKSWVEIVEGSNWGSVTSSYESQISSSINKQLNPTSGSEQPPW